MKFFLVKVTLKNMRYQIFGWSIFQNSFVKHQICFGECFWYLGHMNFRVKLNWHCLNLPYAQLRLKRHMPAIAIVYTSL